MLIQPTEHHIPLQPGTKHTNVAKSSPSTISRRHHTLADFSDSNKTAGTLQTTPQTALTPQHHTYGASCPPPRPRPWVITDTPRPLRNRIQTTLLIRTTASPQPITRQRHRSPRTTVYPRRNIRWRNRGPEQVCNHEPRLHDTDNRRPASRPDQSDRSPRTHIVVYTRT